MYSFATSRIKLKLGQQFGWRLLIANHLDQLLWWVNQKHWASVRSYLLHSFLQVHNCAAPFTSHGNERNYAEPKPFSWPELAYVGFSSSNFNVQNHILSTPGDALTTMVHLRTKPNRKLYIPIAYHLSFIVGWWVWKQSCHSLWVPTLYQCWVGTNPRFRTGPGFNLVVSETPSGYNSSDDPVDTLHPLGTKQ